MKTKDKIILQGICQRVDNNRNRNTFYYTKEEYEVHLNELIHKTTLESRLKKIKKLKRKWINIEKL
jgi:hypothetical protein